MTETLRKVIMYSGDQFHLFLNSVHPGQARERSEDTIRRLTIPNTDMGGTVSALINDETLRRITPKDGKVGTVPASFFQNIRIVYATAGNSTHRAGARNIKVALQNRDSKKVVFVTATDATPTEKHMPAVADGWYVLNCDMVAYGGFWAGVKLSL